MPTEHTDNIDILLKSFYTQIAVCLVVELGIVVAIIEIKSHPKRYSRPLKLPLTPARAAHLWHSQDLSGRSIWCMGAGKRWLNASHTRLGRERRYVKGRGGKDEVFSRTWTAMPKRVNYRSRHDPIKKETFAHGLGPLGGLLLSPT